ATRKRGLDEATLERMISGIVRQLEKGGEAEIPAATIGELIMYALRGIDDVAYVRFASVYRNFSEARDFEAFVADLARSVGARQSGEEGGKD
ncbi:MAG: ATP cone domain-containing protein, partial [Pseudomonadota bacterium]